jgi:hypothetical protein
MVMWINGKTGSGRVQVNFYFNTDKMKRCEFSESTRCSNMVRNGIYKQKSMEYKL